MLGIYVFVSGKLVHLAGDKLYVDYTGKKLSCVDKTSGEIIDVEVFVAILPCSGYTFVEATASQKIPDLIGSMNRCLNFIGGVPKAIVPDNLKSAVTKASKYQATVNKTFKDFAKLSFRAIAGVNNIKRIFVIEKMVLIM